MGFAGASALLAMTLAPHAEAAPEWVDRGLTMRQWGLAIDAGLGIAHAEALGGYSAGGLDLDAALSLIDNLEVGLRFGARFANAAGKALEADQYGRLFDLETYGTGGDLFANPELRILGRPLDLSVFELGVEGRATLPFENGTRFSFMLGVPMRLHLARILRVDTGVYVPVVFYENAAGGTGNAVSVDIPAEFWFQVTRAFFVGPIAGVRLNNEDPALGADHQRGVLFGFGLGYSISRFADFKASFLFPRVNGDPGPDFAVGAGIGLHFDG